MAQNTLNGFEFLGTALQQLLMADEIQPGSQPGYELCKKLYSDHVMGQKIVDHPLLMAMHKPREITIPKAPDDGEMLVEAFRDEWKSVSADRHILNTGRLARMYGVSTLGLLELDGDTAIELDFKSLAKATISFNVWDPLNTAGSLVLSQDPNAPEFQRPGSVSVNGKAYHRSRVCTLLNESPLYIEYQSSGFGFLGRSVYQRGLVPLKAFIMTLATDMMVAVKAGVIVAKMEMQSSAVDGIMSRMLGFKRDVVKEAQVGNVINIGTGEDIESLNLQNLDAPYALARKNIIENIATACGTPAKILLAESFSSGLAEGDADERAVADFIDTIRKWLDPVYSFMDEIVMYRAWNEEFYATVQTRYPEEYGNVSYTAAFADWRNSFTATWPNMLDEPDSEKAKAEDVVLKAIIAVVEVLLPALPPSEKAKVIEWMCACLSEKKKLFTSPLILDIDAIKEYEPPQPLAAPEEPKPESASDSAPRRSRVTREMLDGVDDEVRRTAEQGLRLITGRAMADGGAV